MTLCGLMTMGLLHQCPFNFVLSMNFLWGLLWRAMRLMRVDGVSNGFEAYVVTMFHFPSGWYFDGLFTWSAAPVLMMTIGNLFAGLSGSGILLKSLDIFNSCFVCRLDVY